MKVSGPLSRAVMLALLFALVGFPIGCANRNPRSEDAGSPSIEVGTVGASAGARDPGGRRSKSLASTPIETSTFGLARRAQYFWPDADHRRRSIAQVRSPLPESTARSPIEAAVLRLLERAGTELRRGNVAEAQRLTEEASRSAPDRAEPLEMLLVIELFRAVTADGGSLSILKDSVGTSKAAARLARVDPRSPLGVAVAGLRAAAEGDDRRALGLLAWFVGDATLRQPEVGLPIPVEAGRLEEECAVAALRLGHSEAALTAIDAALAKGERDGASRSRLSLLRADALLAAGLVAESSALLEALAGFDGDPGKTGHVRNPADGDGAGAVAAVGSANRIESGARPSVANPVDFGLARTAAARFDDVSLAEAFALLARYRLAAGCTTTSEWDRVLRREIGRAGADPCDELALILVRHASGQASARTRRELLAQVDAWEPSSARTRLRYELMRTMLGGRVDLQVLARSVRGATGDEVATRLAYRMLAAGDRDHCGTLGMRFGGGLTRPTE